LDELIKELMMSLYAHVLAAVDLTDESSEVLAKAREISNDDQAKLSLMTVVKPINYAYAGLATASITSVSTNFEKEARDFATKKLIEMADELYIPHNQTHVFFGPPSQTIKEQSELLDVDLIVIGSHSRHGLGRLLGSTANGVLHGTTCDVLAVRISQEN
jgi:universal stress protein A